MDSSDACDSEDVWSRNEDAAISRGSSRVRGSNWRLSQLFVAILIAMLMVIPPMPLLSTGERGESPTSSDQIDVADDVPEFAATACSGSIPGLEGSSQYYDLVRHWAPIYWHEASHMNHTDYQPERGDFLLRIDFDGDWSTDGNWYETYDDSNDFSAWVYYSVVETASHWFIGYYDYHSWDFVPETLRGGNIDIFMHDNDMEGILLVVKKTNGYGSLVLMETVAHNEYYQYTHDSSVQDGEETIEGYIEMEYFDGSDSYHPHVFVESGGHGIYGAKEDRNPLTGGEDGWHTAFPYGHCIRYVPKGVNETPTTIGNPDVGVGYDLIAIDDVERGFWYKRFGTWGVDPSYPLPPGVTENPMFFDFCSMWGWGYPVEQYCKPPWAWDDTTGWTTIGDGPTYTGEILFHPANLVRVHFAKLGWFPLNYTYNPFAVGLLIDTYYVNWDEDGGNDESDPYLQVMMYDGEGRVHEAVDDDDGWQFSKRWYDIADDDNGVGMIDCSIRVYGINYPDGKGAFGFESKDYDPGADDWLMGDTKDDREEWTHWYSNREGFRHLDWTGSAVDIVVSGDVLDDDVFPPAFYDSTSDPEYLRVNDLVPLDLSVEISDGSGVAEVKCRLGNSLVYSDSTWTDWYPAYPSNQQGYYQVSIVPSVWLDFHNETIYYQWWARDADDDCPHDSAQGFSAIQKGPHVGGVVVIGFGAHLCGHLAAFTTWEGHSHKDYNFDGDQYDYVVSYFEVDQLVAPVYTDKIGHVGSVYGDLIGYHVREVELGEDLNGDNDTSDFQVRCLNATTGEVMIVGFGRDPSIAQDELGIYVAYVLDTSVKIGYGPDGRPIYLECSEVWRKYVTGSCAGQGKKIGYGEMVDAEAGTIAFATHESHAPEGQWHLAPDFSGDGDHDDYVVRYSRGDVVHNTTWPGTMPHVSGDKIAFTYTGEDGGGDAVLGIYDVVSGLGSVYFLRDSDQMYVQASGWNWDIEGSMAVGTTFHWGYLEARLVSFDLQTGVYEGNLAQGEAPSLSGSYVSWNSDESWAKEDVNDDNDTSDPLVQWNHPDPMIAFKMPGLFLPMYVGADLAYSLSKAFLRLHFLHVSVNGTTVVREKSSPHTTPHIPKGLSVLGNAFALGTNVAYEGPISFSMTYALSDVANENNLRMLEFDPLAGQWVDITSGVDSANNLVYGQPTEVGRAIALAEWRGVKPAIDLGPGAWPSTDGRLIAYTAYEWWVGEDLNNDSDQSDGVMVYYDLQRQRTVNTRMEGIMPSVSGGVLAFTSKYYDVRPSPPYEITYVLLDEQDQTEDDSDSYGVNRSTGVTLMGEDPSVSGSIVAFNVREVWVGQDLDGDNANNSCMIRYHDVSTNTTTETYAQGWAATGSGNLIFFLAYDTMHQTVLKYYDISSGITTDTGIVVSRISSSCSGDKISFTTSESTFGYDVNGDYDLTDSVIGYYDVSESMAMSTNLLAEYSSIWENTIALAASESVWGKNLNQDGDLSDSVLVLYDISTGTITNTAEACDPYSVVISGNVVVFTCEDSVRYVTRTMLRPALPLGSGFEYVLGVIGADVGNGARTVRAEIPGGALPYDGPVTIETIETEDLLNAPYWLWRVPVWTLGEIRVGSDLFKIEAGSSGTALHRAARITITYDEGRFDESNIGQLIVATSYDGDGINDYLPILGVDTELNTVSFMAMHLSFFVILVDAMIRTNVLVGSPSFVDGSGVYHVTPKTDFTVTVIEYGKGLLATCYRIDGGEWNTSSERWFSFSIGPSPGAIRRIEYFSVDLAGNRGLIQLLEVSMIYFEVSGTVFLDRYNPGTMGVKDQDESGLGNWRLSLEGGPIGGSRIERTTYSDNIADIGRYEFAELPSGGYWLNLSSLAGYYYTTDCAVYMVLGDEELADPIVTIDFGVLVPAPDPECRSVLEKGWNLWSTPVSVDGLTAKDLLERIGPSGLVVTRIDKAGYRLVSYVAGYSDAFDFPIVVGEGYYLYVTDSTAFTLTGILQSTIGAPLTQGWNFIGYNDLRAIRASELLSSVQGAQGLVVVCYDPDAGALRSYVVGYSAEHDFWVTPGRAYFIWVDGPGTLAGG